MRAIFDMMMLRQCTEPMPALVTATLCSKTRLVTDNANEFCVF